MNLRRAMPRARSEGARILLATGRNESSVPPGHVDTLSSVDLDAGLHPPPGCAEKLARRPVVASPNVSVGRAHAQRRGTKKIQRIPACPLALGRGVLLRKVTNPGLIGVWTPLHYIRNDSCRTTTESYKYAAAQISWARSNRLLDHFSLTEPINDNLLRPRCLGQRRYCGEVSTRWGPRIPSVGVTVTMHNLTRGPGTTAWLARWLLRLRRIKAASVYRPTDGEGEPRWAPAWTEPTARSRRPGPTRHAPAAWALPGDGCRFCS